MKARNKGMPKAVGHSPVHLGMGGFSLIELMVASIIGTLMMLAILTLYLNVSRTNDEMGKVNEVIENGRFAIQLLQNDIAHAGFWDVYVPDFDDLTLRAAPSAASSGATAGTAPVAFPDAVPEPCLAYSSWPGTGTPVPNSAKNLLGIVVQVHDSVPSGCSGVITNRKNGTDILVVRHAETCEAGATGCEATGSDSRLYLQASRCLDDADDYVLSTSDTELDLRQRNCTSAAPKRRFVSNLYYVRTFAVTQGDGIPTLVRSEFDLTDGAIVANPPVALVEGVEGFRVDLGVDRISDAGIDIISDTDTANRYTAPVKWANANNLTSPVNRGDGVPDEFVHCDGVCSVERLTNVVAVRLGLLVRSRTSTQDYVDNKSYTLGSQTITPASGETGFKRHAFTTLVRLNNISGRRETP